jgi:hypothetical protein
MMGTWTLVAVLSLATSSLVILDSTYRALYYKWRKGIAIADLPTGLEWYVERQCPGSDTARAARMAAAAAGAGVGDVPRDTKNPLHISRESAQGIVVGVGGLDSNHLQVQVQVLEDRMGGLQDRMGVYGEHIEGILHAITRIEGNMTHPHETVSKSDAPSHSDDEEEGH